MKTKHRSFDTKVFSKGRVYLPASDCAEVLGYETKEQFLYENPGVEKTINGISDLVAEDDYNSLLVKNLKAFKVQRSIEMTKVTSLNADITSFFGMYPLKFAFAGPMYEAKARDKGCESVEEYIERYDYPKEAKRILREFKKSETKCENYDKEVSFVMDQRIFVPKVMAANGVELQLLTVIEKDKLDLQAFLVGDGIFYHLYLYGSYDEYYFDANNNEVDSREEADHIEACYGDELFAQMYTNEVGELCIPTYDDTTGDIMQKTIGRTVTSRDFREYNLFENLVWAIQNSVIDRDSVDMAAYSAPGIYMYLDDSFVIQLAFHNDPETVIVEGIVEYDIKNKITKIRNLPVFPHEAQKKKIYREGR